MYQWASYIEAPEACSSFRFTGICPETYLMARVFYPRFFPYGHHRLGSRDAYDSLLLTMVLTRKLPRARAATASSPSDITAMYRF